MASCTVYPLNINIINENNMHRKSHGHIVKRKTLKPKHNNENIKEAPW